MNKCAILTAQVWLLILLIVALNGCANPRQTMEELSYKNLNFIDGTIVIGHIGGCLTKEEIVNGCNAGYGVYFPPLYKELLLNGYNDDEIKKCSIAIIEHSAHWHNANSGYDSRDGTKWAYADKKILPLLVGGEVVEIEISGGIGKIVNIHHKITEDKICQMEKYSKNPVASLIDALNPFGGPGSASIVCSDLNPGEWKKFGYGMYGEFMMIKIPVK